MVRRRSYRSAGLEERASAVEGRQGKTMTVIDVINIYIDWRKSYLAPNIETDCLWSAPKVLTVSFKTKLLKKSDVAAVYVSCSIEIKAEEVADKDTAIKILNESMEEFIQLLQYRKTL